MGKELISLTRDGKEANSSSGEKLIRLCLYCTVPQHIPALADHSAESWFRMILGFDANAALTQTTGKIEVSRTLYR